MKESFSVSFIIPVFNESKRLQKTFEALRRFRPQKEFQDFEVIFVNDGSTDNTYELVSSFVGDFGGRTVSYDRNRGKGYAVTRGMSEARGDYRLFFDADISTPIEEFNKFIPLLRRGADVIIGTRKSGSATLLERQSWHRETMGKVFTLLANLMTGASVSDFTCGFKCFSKKSATMIFSATRIERWSYDAEILFYARKMELDIIEVPVIWKNDKQTSVHLFKDSIKSFIDLFKIRFFGSRWLKDGRQQ